MQRHAIGIVTFVVAMSVAFFARFFPLLNTDTLCRYAPMAEAFSRGEWAEAFHPRFGVGLQVLSGTLCRFTGLDGLSACAAVASVGWALTLIPLFRLAEFISDRRGAWVVVVLYLLCPQLLIWGLKGSRETFKILGLVLMVDAVFRAGLQDWSVFWEALLGLACLLLFKVDSIVFAFVLLVLFALRSQSRIKSVLLGAAFVILLQPGCVVVWYWEGWWLPAPQYIKILSALTGGAA